MLKEFFSWLKPMEYILGSFHKFYAMTGLQFRGGEQPRKDPAVFQLDRPLLEAGVFKTGVFWRNSW